MKALLLAAGRGTRISRYLNGKPKCMVDLGNGEILIDYTINMLQKKGISEIAVVTGYQHTMLEMALEQHKGVRTYYAPFFDVTNSIASAWFARDFLKDDDIIIMNADVFCEEKLYDEMLSVKESPVMFYDTSRIEEADYKFYCPDGKIVKYGKELTPEETTGEYVGLAKMNKDFLPQFTKQLEEMIGTQQHGVWWENVLYALSDKITIHAYDVAPKFWAEVDYVEDYERIKKFVKKGV